MRPVFPEIAPKLYDLGEWLPSLAPQRRPFTLEEEWRRTVETRIGPGAYGAEVRPPSAHTADFLRGSDTMRWHQDCEGKAMFLIIWVNVHPTEILRGNADIRLQAGRVYALWNNFYLHRTPLAAIDAPRFFARLRLVRPELVSVP